MRLSLVVGLILFSPSLTFALIHGRLLTGTQDVVRLVFKNDWVCTGVFIDACTILTAAHCLSPVPEGSRIELRNIETENNLAVNVTQVKPLMHPEADKDRRHSHDIGLIKTSENTHFNREFKLAQTTPYIGHAILFGAGKSDANEDLRARRVSENRFLRLGAVLYFLGKSTNGDGNPGQVTSIAPNDSGGPVIDKGTGKIIAVAATTTLKQSFLYGLPTLSTAASTTDPSNLEFIKQNMGCPKR